LIYYLLNSSFSTTLIVILKLRKKIPLTFVLGIANYYARTLPFKFGLIDQQKLLQGINVEASAYYTNPSRGMSDDEANRRAWEDFEVQRLPYNRGALYLFDANAKIRDKSKGTRSIDESVLELLRRKENRQRYGLNEWLDMMVKELGPSGKEDWERMGNGELVIPVPNALGLDFELGRSDQEPFELGFSYTSLTSRIISGLIPGSRAAKAGLRDGDVLLRNDYLGNSADHYERNLNLVIRRDGREIVINYWPRKWEKVECWQWFDRSSLVATYESQYRLTHP
jgi:predicted metalloprotease with PDZ domain